MFKFLNVKSKIINAMYKIINIVRGFFAVIICLKDLQVRELVQQVLENIQYLLNILQVCWQVL